MALSKKRDKERKRLARLESKNVQPKQEKITELRQLIETTKSKSRLDKTEIQPKLPVYNPHIHKPGDKVLFKVGKKYIETIVPELDGGGQPIQEYW